MGKECGVNGNLIAMGAARSSSTDFALNVEVNFNLGKKR
jgi:hypothetical protein